MTFLFCSLQNKLIMETSGKKVCSDLQAKSNHGDGVSRNRHVYTFRAAADIAAHGWKKSSGVR